MKTEKRREITRSWMRGKNGESLFNGYTVSIQEDEKVLEMGTGDGCKTF